MIGPEKEEFNSNSAKKRETHDSEIVRPIAGTVPVLPPRLQPEVTNIPALPPRPGFEEEQHQTASIKVELTYDIADRDNFS